ncbi:cupin [Caballeronia zhejiangensis]|uniref:Cupin n=1 Tax=Caballeronia zhejiangensis TaxID=871203 RepID=A0A656QQZ5_9BURK|nr:cupin [Caballeronia zhejiangensis]
MIDNNWRGWIAENLLLSNSPNSIVHTLIQHGFDPENARVEVAEAEASPYLRGFSRLSNRLKKRDWMLGVYAELHRMRGGTEVPRREKLSVDEFFEEYYCQNRPVIITGMMEDWPSRERWTFKYLKDKCGDLEVEVQLGRNSDPNFEINQENLRHRLTFAEFVDRVAAAGNSNDLYMTANNNSKNRQVLERLRGEIGQLPYLTTDENAGFFWFGPAGTKTPLHHDLTNNFMAQVVGSKRLNLIPFFDTPNVYNHRHCYSDMFGDSFDTVRFPRTAKMQHVEVNLNAGEVLFLPIGWWHYVEGTSVSITMTYTNFVRHNHFFQGYETFHEV